MIALAQRSMTAPEFWAGVVVGAGALLGVWQIPNVAIMSAPHAQCETARAGCEAAMGVLEENRTLAWEKYRACREGERVDR